MKQVKDLVEKYAALLPLNKSISIPEAERRAGEFLSVLATLAELKHSFSDERIKFTSIQAAVYAQEVNKGQAKTVTENKMNAEASKEYVAAREDFDRVENDISYLRAYQDIFMAAHVFYRNMAKENGQ